MRKEQAPAAFAKEFLHTGTALPMSLQGLNEQKFENRSRKLKI